jgi:transcriptional regulator with XRE-family HTH domain
MVSEQNPNADRIGPVLRAVREGAGMSRRSLATAAGVDHSHLSRVESGERTLSPELLVKVLQAVADRLVQKAEATS